MLMSIEAGLVFGLYVPNFSRKRPSLFALLSAATIQKNGFPFLP